MSPRKPNMLEAFQASAKAEKARQAEAEAAEGSNAYAGATPGDGEDEAKESDGPIGAGGPFAGSTRPVTPKPGARPDARINPRDLLAGSPDPSDSYLRRALGGRGGRGLELSNVPLPAAIAGVVVAMLAMFFLGRWFSSPNETRAADPNGGPEIGSLANSNGDSVAAPGPGDASPAVDGSGLTPADRAFLNRKNRYSVRAIQFPADERGDALALSAYNYLCAQGLPAVAPITQGKIQVICVGAEPSRNAEIERIRAALRALPGPPPGNQRGAFDSAFFVNIEDQIDDEFRTGTP